MLQTFQGMGRGKGFSVISRESGIDDRNLAKAMKPKLLDLVSVFAAHGHTSAAEILAAAGIEVAAPSAATAANPAADLALENRNLRNELSLEKHTREFLEEENTELQTSLRRALALWQDGESNAAISQRQLDAVRGETEKLLAATRESVASLQSLRGEIKDSPRASRTVASHAAKMRGVVEAVQALREALNTERRARRSVTSRGTGDRRA